VKGLHLAGPPRSGMTSRLGLRDPVGRRVKCGPHSGRKSKTNVVDKGWCRVATHDWSLHAGFVVVHHKIDWRLGGRRRDPGALRNFDAGGHVAGSQGLRREDADYGDGVAV
jgi:hypothetical protein